MSKNKLSANFNARVDALHPKMREFVLHAVDVLDDAGVRLKTSPGTHVLYDGDRNAGFFTEYDMYMGIATGNDFWWEIFIHEFCHFLQWKDGISLDVSVCGHQREPYEVMSLWENDRERYSARVVREANKSCFEHELDCERRVLRLIEEHELPIDAAQYTQRANAYILSYPMSLIYGEYTACAPYNDEVLWSKMPTSLDDIDYETSWLKYAHLLWKHCYRHDV